MQKPLIGITAGEIYNYYYPWAPVVHGQRHTFVDSIIRAGGVPIILPLTTNRAVIKELSGLIDGLLLSGGNDINPKQYGEEPSKRLEDVSDLRDSVEKQLLKDALERDIPVLAICRGMQFLNVYNGGNLYQDLNMDLPNTLDHESSGKQKDLSVKEHLIKITSGTKLHDILGVDTLDTNSHHHQGVKKVGKGLRITAHAEDGVIEAIESDDEKFIIGVQSHPESLGETVPTWDKLFKAFVLATNKG